VTLGKLPQWAFEQAAQAWPNGNDLILEVSLIRRLRPRGQGHCITQNWPCATGHVSHTMECCQKELPILVSETMDFVWCAASLVFFVSICDRLFTQVMLPNRVRDSLFWRTPLTVAVCLTTAVAQRVCSTVEATHMPVTCDLKTGSHCSLVGPAIDGLWGACNHRRPIREPIK